MQKVTATARFYISDREQACIDWQKDTTASCLWSAINGETNKA